MSDLFTPQDDQIRFVRVALERSIDPGDGGFTYGARPEIGELHIGDRVFVPLGKAMKRVAGYVVDFDAGSRIKPEKLRYILERDPFSVSLTDDLMTLAKWIGSYYCSPLGMVLASMLPAAVKKSSGRVLRVEVSLAPPVPDVPQPPAIDPSPKPEQAGGSQVSTDSPSASSPADTNHKIASDPARGLTSRHHALLDLVRADAAQGREWVEIKDLADRAGHKTVTLIKRLVQRGLLRIRKTHELETGYGVGQVDSGPDQASLRHALNKSQQAAFERVAKAVDLGGFGVYLLHGVTGSGKTEVYLRVIEHVLQKGGEKGAWALVLVPEIALTPQAVSRFKGRFGQRVAVLHSGLTGAQRNEQWRQVRSGAAHIIVGARSAVFAPISISPVPAPGIIIVDEEHESSYKQDQLPRYHARDVAIKRAQLLGVPVLLGSATPSLESYWNATPQPSNPADPKSPVSAPKFHLLTLPDRVAGIQLPKVEIIDMVAERRSRRGIHLMSQRLEHELTRTLDMKAQAILLLNRRGYANYIACPDHKCGWMMTCDHCDATMVYHKDASLPLGGLVRCHHCSEEQILPGYCPQCSKKVTTFGLGTQRVEEELSIKFPAARVVRMDSDAMRTGKDYQRCLAEFGAAQIDILVGTQMIAKGLDFPNVRLVGVISADTSLHMPDFRAAERTFSLIAQVAGRAGRGDPKKLGSVIVQTFSPDDPTIGLAAQHDYVTFANQEIQIRRDTGLPPSSRMARIVIRDMKLEQCFVYARKLTDMIEEQNALLNHKVKIHGPVPCAIARIAGFHRQQIELIAPDASTLQRLLTAVRNSRGLHADARTAVDVDPVSML